RKCSEVFRRSHRRARASRNTRREADCAQGAGSWSRNCSRGIKENFQAISPRRESHVGAHQRDRVGIVHREVHCEEARWIGICRESRRRAGDDDRAGTAATRQTEAGRMSRVLVVEDEAHLAQGLRFNLEAEGYQAEVVGDGESATDLLLARQEKFDAVVLDIMLPGKDGFHVVSELRAARNYVPVLMLTARGRPEDVLKGFASGADDYLPKPFDLSILLARLQGLLRRSQWGRAHEPGKQQKDNAGNVGELDQFSFAGKTIDFGALELRSRGNTVHLTVMESELLRHLVRNDGKIVARKQILEEVWGLHEDTDTRAIDNFVVRLRRYIEDNPGHPRHLLTVRGVGYRFFANPESK